MAKRRPLFRYHGGKFKIADWVVAHFPPHDSYLESFGGGGSVMLAKPTAKAEVYNDLDTTIVEVFQVLRSDRAGELIRLLELTPFSRDEFRLAYQAHADPVERARRTIVRSFMGYGGDGTSGKYSTGFRLQVTSTLKVPSREWATYPYALRTTIDRLKDVVLENKDAMVLIPQMDGPGTLHYVDPPYLPETRSQDNRRRGAGFHVYEHELTTEQHVALLALLTQVDGMVVLSGYPSELYDDMLPGWQCRKRVAYADRGRKRTECLFLNPATQRALDHGPLFA